MGVFWGLQRAFAPPPPTSHLEQLQELRTLAKAATPYSTNGVAGVQSRGLAGGDRRRERVTRLAEHVLALGVSILTSPSEAGPVPTQQKLREVR